jgi:putative ABC transport system permease protein
MITDYVLFSVKGIRQRKMRSWLTIIGIIIGVAAIVSLITLGQGMQNSIEDQFNKLGINNIRVIPAGLQGPPGGGLTLPNSFIEKTESLKGVEYVDAVVTESKAVEFDNEIRYISLVGYDPDLGSKGFADIDIGLEDGRYFSSGEGMSAIIGYNVAHDFFDKEIPLKSSLIIGDAKFKVIGIFEKTGTIDDRIYLPLDKARNVIGQQDTVNALVVKVMPGFNIEEQSAIIKSQLSKSFDKDSFDVLTPKQILERIGQILGIVSTILGGIAAISLLVGAIGIMNSMFTSVLERTREIGLMKAIGAMNSQIFYIFLIESGFMGLSGGAIGAGLGTGIAVAAGTIAQLAGVPLLAVHVDIGVIAIALVVSFLVGVASGIIPAWRAAHLDPVEALRYE